MNCKVNLAQKSISLYEGVFRLNMCHTNPNFYIALTYLLPQNGRVFENSGIYTELIPIIFLLICKFLPIPNTKYNFDWCPRRTLLDVFIKKPSVFLIIWQNESNSPPPYFSPNSPLNTPSSELWSHHYFLAIMVQKAFAAQYSKVQCSCTAVQQYISTVIQ